VTGEGLRIRPWVVPWPTGGSYPSPVPPQSPENRSHGHSGRLGGRLAESTAEGSPVTHELDPGRGRSTPGFGLPANELDILAVEDRGTETGGGVALDG